MTSLLHIAGALLLATQCFAQDIPCRNQATLDSVAALGEMEAPTIHRLTDRDLKAMKRDATGCQVKYALQKNLSRAYNYALIVEFALLEEQERFALKVEKLAVKP